MKKLILLTGVLSLSGVRAYTAPPVVMHNRAQIVCSGTGAANNLMYIGGSLQATSDITNSDIIVEKGRVKLTGDLINDVNRDTGGTVFSSGAMTAANAGVVEFCGTSHQSILTTKTTLSDTPSPTDIPSKLSNFIDFPNLEINNVNHVTLDARLAARTKNIKLTKGWLILDSDLAKKNLDGNSSIDEVNESVLAHLLVDGQVNYNMASWTPAQDINERGFIQVNLKIPSEGHLTNKSIVGFGSPFKSLYADYFMFNNLLAPSKEGFLANGTITNPKQALEAGRGHVVGIDLLGDDPQDYLDFYQPDYKDIIKFNQRAKDGYLFNRSLFHSEKPDNEVFAGNITSQAYTDEELNTDDVIVPLKGGGYNYLSNPYTCPLNINKLLGRNQAQTTWGVYSDLWSNEDANLWNQVWILNTASTAKYNPGTKKIKYTYAYQVAMLTGGTYTEDDEVAGITPIAPLQMFLVWSHEDQNIIIPKSERVMATTRFLRNAPVVNKRQDDFIMEFRNLKTQTTDRLSFVLRAQEELKASGFSNVKRLASNSTDNDPKALIYDGIVQNHASQVYTKEQNGNALTVQFLPLETTDYIQLYHIAPLEEQDLQVLGRRIATKDRVENMWLEDKLYNTTTEITPDMVYQTVSKPGDPVNRFGIRLKNGTSIGEETQTQYIYAYTQAGNIVVQGFIEQDYGTRVELFDLNGRLLARKEAGGPSLILYQEYQPGVYLIKVNANKPQTMKLIAH